MTPRLFDIFKKHIRWIICIICFVIFVLLAINIIQEDAFLFDETMYNLINKISSSPMTTFFKLVTRLVSGYFLIPICIIVLLFVKNRKFFYLISLNLINTTIINRLLKLLFARERPVGIAIIEETGYSFPSGHSMASLSFYGLLIYIVYHSKLPILWKRILIIILITIVVLIGISRIYLGVHYTSDVIGGFCLSLSYLIVFTFLSSKYLLKE